MPAEPNLYTLSFDPIALERCFMTAEILEACFDEPHLEYGLLALARADNPFHVVETPLLFGQQVTTCSVHQAGYDVLRMREEVDALSIRRGERLIPIALVHRHPGACGMSLVDERFLLDVLINQVSTVFVRETFYLAKEGDFGCDCLGSQLQDTSPGDSVTLCTAVWCEYSVAFSVIVNKRREHSIDAAVRRWCPVCWKSRTSLAPAAMLLSPEPPLGRLAYRRLQSRLEAEIKAKIAFDGAILAENAHA